MKNPDKPPNTYEPAYQSVNRFRRFQGVKIEGERPEDRQPIPGTRSGNWCLLECGHIVQSFGDLRHVDGVVLCMVCRDEFGKDATEGLTTKVL